MQSRLIMANDESGEGDRDGRTESTNTNTRRSSADGSTAENTQPTGNSTDLTKADWEKLASNPDFETDFGYRVSEWESFETADNSDQVMFLPADESLIEEDAFIVAEAGTLCDLGNQC